VRSLNPSGTSFGAVLPNQSGCETVLLPIESSWASPGEVGERVWGKLSDECRYRPASGSSGAWFYGCDVGVDADDLLDQKAGWRFGATACVPTKRPVCKDVAASRLVSGRARVRRTGRTDLRLVEAVSYPGGQRLRSAAVTLERLPLEEDGAGELINHPSGVDRAPARPLRVRHRAERAPFATADHRRGPLVTCRLRDRGRRFDRGCAWSSGSRAQGSNSPVPASPPARASSSNRASVSRSAPGHEYPCRSGQDGGARSLQTAGLPDSVTALVLV
jgi:hypothetical protein